MALPQNYKQIAMQSPGPSHMMSPGMSNPLSFNILKERLRASGGGIERKDTASPFSHSIHGNPAFTPQKVGKSSASLEARAPKPPKAPEKPLMPYWRYSRKVWDQVKTDNPEMKLWEVSKLIGQQWRDLSDEEKQEYINEYEGDKADYEKQLKTYHSSPPYLAYLSAKSKSKSDSDIHHEPQRKQADRRIDIQPAEDDDDPDQDGFSVKHVAYARYLRNHRLINEIFSDAVMPDVRYIVMTQRMANLKRQVQQLAKHQMNLQADLQQIEENFETKKRRFIESSEAFQDELKRHCKPAVDDEKFKQMVERQFEVLKRERMRAMEQQQQQGQPIAPAAPGPASVGATEATPAVESTPPTGSVTEMKAPEKTDEPETIGSDPQQPAATSAPVPDAEKPDEAPSEPMEVDPPAKQIEEPSKPEPIVEEPTPLQAPAAAPVAVDPEEIPDATPVEPPKVESSPPVENKEAAKPATDPAAEKSPQKESPPKVMAPPQIPPQQPPVGPPSQQPPTGAQPPHMPPYHQGYQGYGPSAYGPGPYQHYPQHYPPYGYHNQFPQGPGYAPTPYHYGAPQQSPPGPPPTAMTEHAPPGPPMAAPVPVAPPVAEPAAPLPVAAEPEKKPE